MIGAEGTPPSPGTRTAPASKCSACSATPPSVRRSSWSPRTRTGSTTRGADVLAFVARRIEADAIAMLITSREEIPRSLRGAGPPEPPAGAAGPGRGGSAPARPRPVALPPPPASASWPRRRAIRSGWWSCWPAPRRRPELRWGCRSARGWSGRSRRASPSSPKATRTALLVAALSERADLTEVLAAASRISEHPLGLEAADAGGRGRPGRAGRAAPCASATR